MISEIEYSRIQARRREACKQFALHQCVKIVGGTPASDIGKEAIVIEDPEQFPYSQFVKVAFAGESTTRFYLPNDLAIAIDAPTENPDYRPSSRKAAKRGGAKTAALRVSGSRGAFTSVRSADDRASSEEAGTIPFSPLSSSHEYTNYPERKPVEFLWGDDVVQGWAIAENPKNMIRINVEFNGAEHQSDIPRSNVTWLNSSGGIEDVDSLESEQLCCTKGERKVFQVGDRVRIVELAGRNRIWLNQEATVVQVDRHTQIEVEHPETNKLYKFFWHPNWLELIEPAKALEPSTQTPPITTFFPLDATPQQAAAIYGKFKSGEPNTLPWSLKELQNSLWRWVGTAGLRKWDLSQIAPFHPYSESERHINHFVRVDHLSHEQQYEWSQARIAYLEETITDYEHDPGDDPDDTQAAIDRCKAEIFQELQQFPPSISVGDWVELIRSTKGDRLPPEKRNRGQVVRVYKGCAEVRFRGEFRSESLTPLFCFCKCPDRPPLPYPVKPLQNGPYDRAEIPSVGTEVVVIAHHNPFYGKSFAVAYCSIYGVFRADDEGFAYEELGYRVEEASNLQPSRNQAEQRRSTLLKRVDAVRRSGAVAPKGCWIELAPVRKKLSTGEVRVYEYWRIKAYEPIFQAGAKATRTLHLGTASDPTYKEWCQRFKRRRLIAQIEKEIDKIERQLQREKQLEEVDQCN